MENNDEEKKEEEIEHNILYILIGYGPKPLAGYGLYQGEFIDICEKKLKKVEQNKSANISTSDYRLYYQNVETITYMIMTLPSYPMGAAIACLESMQKEFGLDILSKELENIEEYGLNSEFKQKLKMKFEYYETHPEILNETTHSLKEGIKKLHKEVIDAQNALYQRESLVSDIQDKAEGLGDVSDTFRINARGVRKAECCKKCRYCFVVIAVIAVIATVIFLIVYL